MKNIREQALAFATKAHAGQKRKDGQDYITHVVAVAERAEQIMRKRYSWAIEEIIDQIYVIGLLHDTIEDCGVTKEQLETHFGRLACDVQILSRPKDENYFDFIMRVSKYFFPSVVKVADLEHNMSDLKEGSLKDKYRFAHNILIQNL